MFFILPQVEHCFSEKTRTSYLSTPLKKETIRRLQLTSMNYTYSFKESLTSPLFYLGMLEKWGPTFILIENILGLLFMFKKTHKQTFSL